jgi:(2R)-sulfolactate sulfo-lyase subunit beta
MIDRHKTDNLCRKPAHQGNIAGGLATIEEKAFSNLQKIGKRCKYLDAVDKAVAPAGPGLLYMDFSSTAAEAVMS